MIRSSSFLGGATNGKELVKGKRALPELRKTAWYSA
jgi:hypothetical protein